MRGGPRGFRPGFPCPAVLRYSTRRLRVFAYGTVTLCGATFHALRLTHDFVTPDPPADGSNRALQPLTRQRLPPVTSRGLGCSLFARHYSGSRDFFPFLRVLRCFSSPACLSAPYVFRCEYHAHYQRVGFPIRRSRGQRLVSTSPGLIAAAHVLHRLLAPRHPPCALVLLIKRTQFSCRYGVFKVHAGDPARPRAIRPRCAPCGAPAPVSQNSTANEGWRLPSNPHRGRR